MVRSIKISPTHQCDNCHTLFFLRNCAYEIMPTHCDWTNLHAKANEADKRSSVLSPGPTTRSSVHLSIKDSGLWTYALFSFFAPDGRSSLPSLLWPETYSMYFICESATTTKIMNNLPARVNSNHLPLSESTKKIS